MEIQEIAVRIAPDGTVKLEVRGVKGPQCLALTADLEKLLGGQILHREHTAEFDQPAEQAITESDRLQQGL